MEKIRPVLGYIMAVFSCLISAAILPAIATLSEPFITATGLTISPNYSGGEVVQTIDHGAYETHVHRMVFDDTLIGERKEGFIQVDWTPLDALPARIDEEIDADGDGQADFRVELDTASKEAMLTPYASWVLELEGAYKPKGFVLVRVRLDNPAR
ncbi:MAG: hypothetical protein JXA14_09360 [Anaerolineae bacterium]|nr:hypothetical protein [Anaerolineae bacterium]